MSSLGIVCSPLGDDGSDRFVCPGCLLSKRGLTEPSCWIGVAFVAVLSVSPGCAFGLPMSRNCSRFLCDLPSLYCSCFAPIKNSMMLA